MNCQICGKPSGYFQLCKSCFKLKDENKVMKCPNCDKWRKTDEVCPSCGSKPIQNLDTDKQQESDNELTCIVCGSPSNGKHFCLSCYHKYKDREIEVHFKNCTESFVSDEYCNRKYTCDDGRKVRSKSEKIISDFLFKHKVRAVYEKTVFYYTAEGDAIELKPDFYLPDYNIYIEHNGLNSISYKANKERTKKMYKDLNYELIVTTEDDLEDIDKVLKPILKLN